LHRYIPKIKINFIDSL